MCVRGTHTGIILYYLFIILSAKGSFCRMFQRFGYPTEVINAMYSPFPRWKCWKLGWKCGKL